MVNGDVILYGRDLCFIFRYLFIISKEDHSNVDAFINGGEWEVL